MTVAIESACIYEWFEVIDEETGHCAALDEIFGAFRESLCWIARDSVFNAGPNLALVSTGYANEIDVFEKYRVKLHPKDSGRRG